MSITEDAMDLLAAYHWPGNIRQLKAIIESIGSRIQSDTIRESDICQAIPQVASIYGTKSSKIFVGRYGASLSRQGESASKKLFLLLKAIKRKPLINLECPGPLSIVAQLILV